MCYNHFTPKAEKNKGIFMLHTFNFVRSYLFYEDYYEG